MSIVALTCALIAIDGDTLRCGSERIRLLGIDAPEMPGHCQEGRNCAPGDPVASKNALSERAKGPATIERIGRDHYDRTLARVRVNGIDLSCAQIQSGHAIYRPDWDQFAFIATDDVTPAFHPAATRDRPLLSRRSAGEATVRFKPAQERG
ncbi:thermonuclease family protein [Sphingomonas sp. Leaf16]|uniref:thermonuclease family protein n=1 Tax=Sphingomonas sp. Leaf16 TaxID=1735681 RepID=UPI0009EAD2DE|nr:thermonuclease family protein [Sphingomonas sp. Leaf16]